MNHQATIYIQLILAARTWVKATHTDNDHVYTATCTRIYTPFAEVFTRHAKAHTNTAIIANQAI